MAYTIGEVSEKMDIASSTLRYYDKEGLLPFVDRTESGIRMFKESDFEWLKLIDCLKKTGMSIKDIKQFIDWYMEGDSTLKNRSDMFHERREAVLNQIESMQKMLDIINYKCWFYDKAVELGSSDKAKNMNTNDIPEEIKYGKEKLKCWSFK